MDIRDFFRTKKRNKSFQVKAAFDIEVINSNNHNSITNNINSKVPGKKSRSFSKDESKSPKARRSRIYCRSSSTADVEIVLHNAVIREDIETLERVLKEDGLQINKMSASGFTALHQASILGNLTCVEMLMKRGADLHAKSKEKETALQLAVKNSHFEVAEYLIAMGARDSEIKDGIQSSQKFVGETQIAFNH